MDLKEVWSWLEKHSNLLLISPIVTTELQLVNHWKMHRKHLKRTISTMSLAQFARRLKVKRFQMLFLLFWQLMHRLKVNWLHSPKKISKQLWRRSKSWKIRTFSTLLKKWKSDILFYDLLLLHMFILFIIKFWTFLLNIR